MKILSGLQGGLKMSVKINKKMLSIPPYLSAAWHQIASLHFREDCLVASLYDGNSVEIPGLTNEQVGLIFSYHADHLEYESLTASPHIEVDLDDLKDVKSLMGSDHLSSLQLGLTSPFNGSGSFISQHNPLMSDSPEIPQEVLEKIVKITHILNPNVDAVFSKIEEECGCFHCQIGKALGNKGNHNLEAAVEDHELQFQQWIIEEIGQDLFQVQNKLDVDESYKVFLGEKVGCTCGKQGCEHLLAVLKT